jgi:PmbA protein
MPSKTVSPQLFDTLDALLRKSRALGADAADAVIVDSTSLAAAIRNHQLDTLERSERTSLGLRVLIGKRQASLSTQDIRKDELENLVTRTVAAAKVAPEDPYAGLADEKDLAKTYPDLDMCDEKDVSSEHLIHQAQTLENSAREDKRITQIEEASASWGASSFVFATSHGFKGAVSTTNHYMSVQLVAGTGTEMVRDYDDSHTLFGSDLRSPEDIAKSAILRTISRLNARKMGTGKMPVVFAPRVANGLLQGFLSAINGQAVARKSTFLIDALGTEIFSPHVQIIDDPLRKRGVRSKPFDGEGLPVKKTALIENGRLTTWMLNNAAARQLGLKSTAHASRGIGGVPGISASNAYMAAGKLSPEDLIADIREGFYVTETMGFGVNTLTGDYSQGAAGFWIENGKIAFPVHEMTIAGNLREMFKALTPANDLTLRYGVDAPTLRIEGMMVAGN